MPDDVTTPAQDQDEIPAIVHDTIMKRLLNHQRGLREGDPGSAATRDLVDLTAVELSDVKIVETTPETPAEVE